jgi:hypothetical protein
MSAGVQHPHDKLFRTVFADTEEAASFLRVTPARRPRRTGGVVNADAGGDELRR